MLSWEMVNKSRHATHTSFLSEEGHKDNCFIATTIPHHSQTVGSNGVPVFMAHPHLIDLLILQKKICLSLSVFNFHLDFLSSWPPLSLVLEIFLIPHFYKTLDSIVSILYWVLTHLLEIWWSIPLPRGGTFFQNAKNIIFTKI